MGDFSFILLLKRREKYVKIDLLYLDCQLRIVSTSNGGILTVGETNTP